MAGAYDSGSAIAPEVHFSGRRMRCFTNRPRGVDQLLREAVARNGDGDAIVGEGVRLTYRALDATVDSIAANFQAIGVGAGDRVAIAMSNRAEFLTVLLAAIRIAAIVVPINVREQTPGFTHILNHSGAAVLVHDGDAAGRLPEPEATPGLGHRFSIGDAGRGARPFEALVADTGAAPDVQHAQEEDVAVILYTSGTTGPPKGVMLTHLNICHSVMHFEQCMALGQADRALLAVPASHITGLIASLLTMVRVAGCNILLARFTVDGFLDLAAAERMTYTLMVPAMYNLCLMRADLEAVDLSGWRIGGYGGAPMPRATIAALAETLPELVLVNAYGATETTSPATIMPMGDTAAHADSVGKVVPCGEMRIVDAQGCDVAVGEAGEVWIAGPMVTPGYWNDEEITSASIVGGYWKSGDVGSIDAQGYVRLHDRMKDMIIRGGYNVYSAEVENVLTMHPAVIECAAVAQPDPVLGEKVHVFVHMDPGAAGADELQRFCAERLADYKVPDFVTVVGEPLPRNANGKVLKGRLRELAAG